MVALRKLIMKIFIKIVFIKVPVISIGLRFIISLGLDALKVVLNTDKTSSDRTRKSDRPL